MGNWRKSSHSIHQNCVEVASFRKSSFSMGAGDCVEVGTGPAVVGVRDSQLAESPVLEFSGETWQAFVAAVKTS